VSPSTREGRALPWLGSAVPHYKHEVHADRCVVAHQSGTPLIAWCQVKLGYRVFCATVEKPWCRADGLSMYKVLLWYGPNNTLCSEAHVPAFKVRQCSGLDTHCACAVGALPAPAGRHQGPPLAGKGAAPAAPLGCGCQ
jgi:hypothetical protein